MKFEQEFVMSTLVPKISCYLACKPMTYDHEESNEKIKSNQIKSSQTRQLNLECNLYSLKSNLFFMQSQLHAK